MSVNISFLELVGRVEGLLKAGNVAEAQWLYNECKNKIPQEAAVALSKIASEVFFAESVKNDVNKKLNNKPSYENQLAVARAAFKI